jgi:hypothetical protein
MSTARAGYKIQLRRNVLDGPCEIRRSPNDGQDPGNDPPESERMAGMDGYTCQELPAKRDFQHKIVAEWQQQREAYLSMSQAIFWLGPIHSTQQLEQH